MVTEYSGTKQTSNILQQSGHFRNKAGQVSMAIQDPRLEVPTIYKAYVCLCKAYVREYPHKIWPYMVQYLHFRILEFPLKVWHDIYCHLLVA